MIRRYLGNYKKFICIADKCPATCCSGWQIEIDEDSLDRYEDLALPNVDFEEGCFRQKKNGDCAFLKENGLCQMILDHGEEMLCHTCDQYPRHTEEFFGVREYSLSISCPEVARMLVEKKEHIRITEEEDMELEDEELFEEFDDSLYEALLECRLELIELIKDKAISFDEKCKRILLMMKEIQSSLYELEEEEIELQLEKIDYKKWYQLLYELEPLKDSFRNEIKKTEETLFQSGSLFHKIKSFQTNHANWEMVAENLMIYFLYTYLCGSVYDDYVYAMGAQAVYNTAMIMLLWMGRYERKEDKLSEKEMAEVIYLYSRELEHSTDNVILLEKLLDEFRG